MQFADLSPAWQRLLRLFQTINFGRIEELEIRNGEPVFSPEPRVFLELKLDAADGPRPERRLDRFELRSQVERFIGQVARMKNGTVERVEVRHGLPFRIVIEAMPAEVES
ncbi:MAG: hypothetical protein HUU41_09400 [Bryobacteraceae bacterium]|nr:hypothetical protein [Bryobacteraceae bacterium]